MYFAPHVAAVEGVSAVEDGGGKSRLPLRELRLSFQHEYIMVLRRVLAIQSTLNLQTSADKLYNNPYLFIVTSIITRISPTITP